MLEKTAKPPGPKARSKRSKALAQKLDIVSLWIFVFGFALHIFGAGYIIGVGGLTYNAYLLHGFGVLDVAFALFLKYLANREKAKAAKTTGR